MDKKEFFAKGEYDNITCRAGSVHTVTIYCPLNDCGMYCMMHFFNSFLSAYKSDVNIWKGVPTIDALRCFALVRSINPDGVDFNVLGIITYTLGAFNRLKYINFEFTPDPKIESAYNTIKSNEICNDIYHLDVLEFNLSDMFSQEIIDHFNKVLVMDGIISNSYLERKFLIEFKFDEYISFMDMFLGNHGPELNRLDNRICDYFRSFPSFVEYNKPDIRIVTNYEDL